MKNILCFGDSNTWGSVPGILTRHPKHVRWTGVLQDELGPDYNIIENGIPGRTTAYDDPANQCRNGLSAIGYALYCSKPLDLVVVMLGPNDLHYTDINGMYDGMALLSRRILNANKLFPGTSDVFPNGAKLLLIASTYSDPANSPYVEPVKKLAEELNVPWFNAAEIIKPSPVDNDGSHLNEENHRILGLALAKKIKTILG